MDENEKKTAEAPPEQPKPEGQQPAAPAPEPGKKDRSFLVVAGGAILLLAILYFIKLL